MAMIKKLKNKYVIWHVNQIKIPVFPLKETVRNKVVFFGKVQNIGFRLETSSLAKRIGLTGKVENREDGSVEAILQGTEIEIDFLIKQMIRLKRANVKRVTVEYMDGKELEESFIISS